MSTYGTPNWTDHLTATNDIAQGRGETDEPRVEMTVSMGQRAGVTIADDTLGLSWGEPIEFRSASAQEVEDMMRRHVEITRRFNGWRAGPARRPEIIVKHEGPNRAARRRAAAKEKRS